MLRQAARWLLVGCGAACGRLAPVTVRHQPPPPSAQFTSSGLELRFPRDACGACRLVGDTVPNRFAGPAWEVMIRPDTGWLAGVLQVFPDRTLHLPVVDSVADLVHVAKPLNCTLSTHVMACGARLRAATEVTPAAVIVRVSDGRWRRRLRAGRPDSLNLAFRQRNTETLWHQRIAIDYADR